MRNRFFSASVLYSAKLASTVDSWNHTSSSVTRVRAPRSQVRMLARDASPSSISVSSGCHRLLFDNSSWGRVRPELVELVMASKRLLLLGTRWACTIYSSDPTAWQSEEAESKVDLTLAGTIAFCGNFILCSHCELPFASILCWVRQGTPPRGAWGHGKGGTQRQVKP